MYSQSQGQVERLNQTICQSLAKALHKKPKRWIDIHSEVVLGYNTTYHSAIGKSPFEAFKKRVFKRVLPQEELVGLQGYEPLNRNQGVGKPTLVYLQGLSRGAPAWRYNPGFLAGKQGSVDHCR